MRRNPTPAEQQCINAERRLTQQQRDLSALYRKDGSRSPIWAGILFHKSRIAPCAAAIALDGQLLQEHPVLPLVECDSQICACHWRLMTRRETEGR